MQELSGADGTAADPGEQSGPGDAPHFQAWVAPHLPVMSRVAARLAPTAEREDVVQDALTRAWHRRATFDPDRGTAAAWLCAIVAGEARRTRQRIPAGTVQLPDTAAPGPPERPGRPAVGGCLPPARSGPRRPAEQRRAGRSGTAPRG